MGANVAVTDNSSWSLPLPHAINTALIILLRRQTRAWDTIGNAVYLRYEVFSIWAPSKVLRGFHSLAAFRMSSVVIFTATLTTSGESEIRVSPKTHTTSLTTVVAFAKLHEKSQTTNPLNHYEQICACGTKTRLYDSTLSKKQRYVTGMLWE